ncbi:type VII secretion protein EccCb [Streptomyces anulatus]|uniref:type VII secretion protein EccCb n=1 Tax=Streptomyces anulatus TaxID=1892 RepID=UPI0032498CC1
MAGRRIALLVATDGYVDPGLNQLRSPVRGAGELEGLLKDESVGRFDSVRTLTNRPKDEVERQIESLLSNRDPDDLVLLYLSCHGIRTDSGRLFFATVSTDLSLPQSTAVRADLIHHLLDECEARTKIVLLDCCYSGLFHQGTPMSPAPVDVKGALAGRGTFVITASTSLEYAYEGRQLTLDNSLPSARFTAAINEGLRTGQADLDHDGVITPDELYTYVHAAVVNQSGPEQTPTKSGQCEGNVPLAYAAQIDRSTGRPMQGGRPAELLLGALLPPPVDTADRGFICDSWEGASRLLVPIGRGATSSGGELMCLDLAGRSGNAAVVGRLGSGKTTLLRVLTMSLALTHTPLEAEFYLLEGAVNRLGVLRSMPHVKKVAAAHEHEAVAEVLTALDDAIATRRMLFRDLGIDSVEEFRRLRGTGEVPSDRGSDVFLVIDGWVDFGWEIPDFATKIHRLVNSGLNYGVHLLASARQWNDFDPTLLGLLGSRVELALDDPEDSRVDSSLSAGLSTGWALAHRRRFRVALPHLEEAAGSAEARQALAETTRRMRRLWLGALPDTAAASRAEVEFAGLFGITDAERFDAPRAWQRRRPEDVLRVPIGLTETGEPLALDLKDASQDGMGPHGLCVGTAGSGRTELLRTLILGLAVTHSPDELNFLLVDHEGTAAFDGLRDLPHASGLITGLSRDPTHVKRMMDAISGELIRRQELLRSLGDHVTLRAYDSARAAGTALEPLPSLLIVVDGFAELLDVRRDLMDTFVMLGRVGRSLGVHLLLSSQHLEEGKLRGLENYLSYRIVLRTRSAAESRMAIGVPDSYHLPALPGSAYLTYGSAGLTRFRAAYASAPRQPGDGESSDGVFLADSLLDALVRRVKGQGPLARPVWLPPLDAAPTLDELLPELTVTPERGLHAPVNTEPGNLRVPVELPGILRVPVGLTDKPFELRRDTQWIDFSGASGHHLVVGAPQSGKSTLLRTVICALALTHTPSEVQLYCLDFNAGSLQELKNLPHVGDVTTRLDPERVRRTVAEVVAVYSARQEFFRAQGVDSIVSYRKGRAAGKWPDQQWGDVFLVIDDWSIFKQEHEDLEGAVLDLASRGLGYGIHLLIGSPRHTDLRGALRDCFPGVTELRLADPMDSQFSRDAAATVPVGAPGRGLTLEGLHFLAALPRLAESLGPTLAEATADLVDAVRFRWDGPTAPPVRTLPTLVPANTLPEGFDRSGSGIALGIEGTDLTPFGIDFEQDPHLVVIGESGSGKTSLLRLLTRRVSERYTPAEARLIVVDYRRSLLDSAGTDHLAEYLTSGAKLPSHMHALAETLARRLPGPDVTAEQLRSRSWYTGPDIFLVVDDYELVSTASGNPFAPILEYLHMARDIGLRLVLCRNSTGAARAMYEPVLQQLRRLETTALTLSCDRGEGPLFGSATPVGQPPGRAVLTTRRRPEQRVQLAYLPPPAPD